METTIGVTAQGAIVSEHRPALRTRLAAGAIPALPAAFFGYYLVTGLFEYLRHASAAEWLSALPGVLVVLALFLLAAVPAWIILFGRSWVVVDFQEGQVLAVRDFRVLRRTRRVPLDRLRDVWVAPIKSGRRRSPVHEIRLVVADGKPVTVGYESTGADAAEVARRFRSCLPGGANEALTGARPVSGNEAATAPPECPGPRNG